MALSEEKLRQYQRRLLLSRMRILNNHGFYGLLLMHMGFNIHEGLETAATDGERIYFGPEFLESLSDDEVDFVLMHEILHVVLRHCRREGDRQPKRFNVACDIVVNSNILLENKMDRRTITLAEYGESMHLAPDGKEGYLYTAEQVYDMLPSMPMDPNDCDLPGNPHWDDHGQWGKMAEDDVQKAIWEKRVADACEAISIREKVTGRGLLPAFARRMMDALHNAQTDWRTVLNEFVQMEVNDYSFSPPDRRYEDSPFFLPDFNEMGPGSTPTDILFMVDTSGSMTDAEITAAYSEIKGAVDQFDGKLKGWLGFFDAAVVEPQPFESVDDVLAIRPFGGGGTDFGVIFQYVADHMADQPPACIIILTDGYAPFPREKVAQGIPVLWVIDNETINPPWGKVARIKVNV